jgi:hypothetical protein
MRRLIVILLLTLAPFLSCAQGLFNDRDLAFLGERVLSTDWARRVVTNGGAMPSANTITAMETLRTGLIAAGLTNKIYSLCVFVPDSIIAATTPLIKHQGSDPWTNSNFVDADLSVNGLKGDGTSKALDTGVLSGNDGSIISSTLTGFSIIVSESNSNRFEYNMGYQDTSDGTFQQLRASASAQTTWLSGGASPLSNISTSDFVRVGYLSGNTLTNAGVTNQSIYIASALENHRLFFTEPFSVPLVSSSGNRSIVVFGTKNEGTNTAWSAQRMSMAAIHFPWTETESSNFWWLVKTCRESLGGGTGDPVEDWSRRLVELGGSAISTTSSNAARTFYSGLANDRLIEKIAVANCYFPDNLFACRTPLLWQAGNQVWTNFNFGETNLTVNGLKGDTTTKYLSTSISPSIIGWGGFNDTNAGMTQLTYDAGTIAGNMVEHGTALVSTYFMIQAFGGNLSFYCWGIGTVNANFLTIAPPAGSNWVGYASGNRTAANAIRLDWVTNQVHNIATNGTGTQTGNNNILTNSFAHAFASGATPQNWSDRRVSYLSVHAGLTQTESSNQWWHVANLRTNLGGGVP